MRFDERFAYLVACIGTMAAGAIPSSHASGAESRPGLVYQVALADLGQRTLAVQLHLHDWPAGHLRLRGVPAYLDNPTPSGRGRVVRRLVARDAAGAAIPVRRRRTPRGEERFELDVPPGGAVVSYELGIDFVPSAQTRRYPIEIPFMDDERAWLYGNCVFVAPELPGAPSHAVRTQLDIEVHFDHPRGVPLVGPPAHVHLANLYALQSLQFGYGSFHLEHVGTNSVELALVYRDTLEFRAAERACLRRRTARIVDAVTRFFGTPAYPSVAFYYFRRPGIGGQEGSYALQTYVRPEIDVADTTDARVRAFTRVALHEFFHTWNPVALGTMDDPWVKEGLTSYYDEVLTARLGWSSAKERSHMLDRYKRQLRQNSKFTAIALTDPRIWQREYDGEDWRTLTYDRGQATALLLDLWIRERSDNARGLDEVVRALAADALHGGVSHAAFLDVIRTATGVDAAPFFATHVEGLVAPSAADVDAALARAESLGVFTPAPR